MSRGTWSGRQAIFRGVTLTDYDRARIAGYLQQLPNGIFLGYESEHAGPYDNPFAAVCSVCGELSWRCPHPWELRVQK